MDKVKLLCIQILHLLCTIPSYNKIHIGNFALGKKKNMAADCWDHLNMIRSLDGTRSANLCILCSAILSGPQT